MLTKLQKKELVKEISDQIKKSQGFYLVNFSKLATKELEDLRNKIKEMRFKASSGSLKNVKEFKESKKQVARILTIINNKA